MNVNITSDNTETQRVCVWVTAIHLFGSRMLRLDSSCYANM